MRDVTCPACDLPVSEAAFEAGSCPCCGCRFDAPAPAPEQPADETPVTAAAEVLPPAPPPARRPRVWRTAAVVCSPFACGILVGYVLFARAEKPAATPPPELAAVAPVQESPAPAHPDPLPQAVVPKPVPTPPGPVAAAAVPRQPKPVEVAPAPRVPQRTIVIDPFDDPVRHLDAPDGVAEVVELNGGDHLTLTGRVKVLTLNAVNGSVRVDASGLVAEEVVLAGDIDGNCDFKFNAPNGKVTIRRALVGSCTLTVTAPGGAVTLAEGGRIGGGVTVTLTSKTVDAQGPIGEGARVNTTLTTGGAIRVAAVGGGAVVTYKRAAAGDPEPKVERGERRGGNRVVEVK